MPSAGSGISPPRASTHAWEAGPAESSAKLPSAIAPTSGRNSGPMRFRLRTLLIAAGVIPPAIAGISFLLLDPDLLAFFAGQVVTVAALLALIYLPSLVDP